MNRRRKNDERREPEAVRLVWDRFRWLVSSQALGRVQFNFPVLWFPLEPGVLIDGLLGLDFFRGFVLKIDFIRGHIDLLPKRWWHFWR